MDHFPLKEEYEKVRDLGKGTYGLVKLWRRKKDLNPSEKRPKYVAIKTIVHVSGERHATLRKRELDLLKVVQSGSHRNIIKYFGSFSDNSLTTDQTALVMEACHGDLRKLIKVERELEDEELRMLGEQILHGLHYLHCLNLTTKILHRDLKPENILILVQHIDSCGKNVDWETVPISDIVLKISDYGLGRLIDAKAAADVSQTKDLGTEGYIAPEIQDGKFAEGADVWSYAVIMHELASKDKPQLAGLMNYQHWLSGTPVVLSDKIENPVLIDFLTQAFKSNRKEPSTTRELLLHKFVTNLEGEFHGNIEDLIQSKRHYSTPEIKQIFMKLLELLPTITKRRFIVQEHVLIRSTKSEPINWELLDLNDIEFDISSPEDCIGTSSDIEDNENRAIHFLGNTLHQLMSKVKHSCDHNRLWTTRGDFVLKSFILKMKEYNKESGDNLEILQQHPFLTGGIPSLEYDETIHRIHMTDTDIILGGKEGNIFVVDIKSLKRREMVEEDKSHSYIRCFDSCGEIFAVSGQEGKVSIWKVDRQNNQCKQINVTDCPNESVIKCLRINETFLVTYANDNMIRVYRWAKSEEKEPCGVIKTDASPHSQSMVLQESDLFIVDGHCLRHYKLEPEINEHSQMEFTDRLLCLAPSLDKNLEAGEDRFWIGTKQPGKIIKVDMGTKSVIAEIKVSVAGLVRQVLEVGQHLLCLVQAPTTTYLSCLCYETESLLVHSPSHEIKFRQLVDFGKMTSDLCRKGESHVFYYFKGNFCHLNLRDIDDVPQKTSL